MRFCNFPRSIAISTTRWVEFTGVITRSGRETRLKALVGQERTHTPQPRQRSSLIAATLRFFLAGSLAEIRLKASTGQTLTHFPQPVQFSTASFGRKLLVCTGFKKPNFRAATRASQQQPQQLQIKFTPFCTFSPNCTRLCS